MVPFTRKLNRRQAPVDTLHVRCAATIVETLSGEALKSDLVLTQRPDLFLNDRNLQLKGECKFSSTRQFNSFLPEGLTEPVFSYIARYQINFEREGQAWVPSKDDTYPGGVVISLLNDLALPSTDVTFLIYWRKPFVRIVCPGKNALCSFIAPNPF